MSKQEGWTRWAELIVFVLAALVLALGTRSRASLLHEIPRHDGLIHRL